MATLLEDGGTIELWGGWVASLPPAYFETNGDRTWSAWGADWTMDVTIIEIDGPKNGQLVSPEEMLEEKQTINARGNGWIGHIAHLKEFDNNRDVFRLAATLAARNTTMSCWISYFEPHQQSFAEELLGKVSHRS